MFAICILSKVNKVALHMTTKISVALSEIDDQFLHDLKNQYPEGARLDSQMEKKIPGRSFDYIPPTNYETYANIPGWQ